VLNSLASAAVGLVIGSAAPSTDAALAGFPPLIVLMIIFNGNSINLESVPAVLRWLPAVSLVRWAFEGMCINEFEGLQLEPPPGPPQVPGWLMRLATGRAAQSRFGRARNGEDVLEGLGFADGSLARCVQAQLAIIAVCWAGSLLILVCKDNRALVMAPPADDDNKDSGKVKDIEPSAMPPRAPRQIAM
jgi:hypothetical protein